MYPSKVLWTSLDPEGQVVAFSFVYIRVSLVDVTAWNYTASLTHPHCFTVLVS